MLPSTPTSAIDLQRHKEFELLAIPHMDVLYSFALRMTGNADDSHDLVQDTYLKAYRFWDTFEKGTNIRAWLFRIMKNTYINTYRQEIKNPETVEYDEKQEYYESIRTDTQSPDGQPEKVFGRLLDDDVSKALESLPEEFRTVVILSDIEGLSYEEIADFVQAPVGTIRSRLHRGRKLLHAKLFNYAKERGLIKDTELHEDE